MDHYTALLQKTTGVIYSESLKKMKKNGILVDTASNKIFSDFDYLDKHLREKVEFYMLLDALSVKPARDHSLIKAWSNNID
ncbi:hypothetical protein [Bartonella phoceensis]|uniref:hypothetical protein n=1 Tax=Bartonella phoceensis TaxID=270249 RepID=UPI001FEC8C26|nr:hypothetical protein [Bartonella phoceensis]